MVSCMKFWINYCICICTHCWVLVNLWGVIAASHCWSRWRWWSVTLLVMNKFMTTTFFSCEFGFSATAQCWLLSFIVEFSLQSHSYVEGNAHWKNWIHVLCITWVPNKFCRAHWLCSGKKTMGSSHVQELDISEKYHLFAQELNDPS